MPMGRRPTAADRRTDRRLPGAADQLVAHLAPAEHHRHGPPAIADRDPGVVVVGEGPSAEAAHVRAVPAADRAAATAVAGRDEAAVDGEPDRAADVADVVRVTADRSGRERLWCLGSDLPDRDRAGLRDLGQECVDGLGALPRLHIDHDAAGARVSRPATDRVGDCLAGQLVDSCLAPVQRRSRHRYGDSLRAGGLHRGRSILPGQTDHQFLSGRVQPRATEVGSGSPLSGRQEFGRGRFGLQALLHLLLGQTEVLLHGCRLTRYGERLVRARRDSLAGDGHRAHDEHGG